MAILDYSDITEHKYIVLDGAPYEVLSSHVFRKQQRKPVNATKLKNLITGKVVERSFHVSEKAEEAELEEKEVKYLYNNRGEWWFSSPTDPSNRFKISAELIGDKGKYLKANDLIKTVEFNEETIGLKLPIKVDLKVVEAHPAVRGDTAKGGNKQVVLETGATINVPMFIKEGDILRINTETGEYTDRIS